VIAHRVRSYGLAEECPDFVGAHPVGENQAALRFVIAHRVRSYGLAEECPDFVGAHPVGEKRLRRGL
jgi:hypothetical protein